MYVGINTYLVIKNETGIRCQLTMEISLFMAIADSSAAFEGVDTSTNNHRLPFQSIITTTTK